MTNYADDWGDLRDKIIGLGEDSSKKSYYPELQKKLGELQRFKDLLDYSSDAILQAKGSDGLIIAANQAALALMRLSKDEMIGASIQSVFYSKSARLNISAFDDGAEQKSFQTTITHGDNTVIPIEITIQVALINNESFYIVFFRDISERLKTQAQLSESEQSLRVLFNSVFNSVFVHDQFGNIFEVNDPLLKLYQVSREEALKINITDFSADGTEISDITQKIQNAFEKGETVFEWKAKKPKSGEIFDAEVSLTKSIWFGKQAFVAAVRDISDRKKYELSLKERIIALTQPVKSGLIVKFEDLFNVEDVQKIQDAFAAATGVASIITDIEGKPITKPSNFCGLCANVIRKTKIGAQNCQYSDAILCGGNKKGPILQRCLSGGLWDGGASIEAGGKHIANWMIGQVIDESFETSKMLDYADEIGADRELFEIELAKVTRMSKEKFSDICKALFLIAKQLSTSAVQNIHQAREISDRMAVEKALKASENRFRYYVSAAPYGIIVTDQNGKILTGNVSAREMFEVKTEIFFEINLGKFLEKESFSAWNSAFEQLKISGKMEGDFVGLKNFMRPFNFSSNAVRLNDDTFLFFIKDITDRINYQKEIKELNKFLESKVKERTSQLESALDQLKKASEDVSKALAKEKELNEMKTRFVSIVSHEYRTPLTGILSATYLLQTYFDIGDKENHTKYLSRVQSSVQTMARLLEDVLIIGKSESGMIKYIPEPMDLVELMKDIVAQSSAIDQNKHAIRFTPPYESLRINSDDKILSHILYNLISNALKYSINNTPVEIELKENNEILEITVKDYGIGMPEDEIHNLFSPFHRFSNVGTIQGTGLGLSIVKRCVDLLGGDIKFFSKQNDGSTVSFHFPKERQ